MIVVLPVVLAVKVMVELVEVAVISAVVATMLFAAVTTVKSVPAAMYPVAPERSIAMTPLVKSTVPPDVIAP